MQAFTVEFTDAELEIVHRLARQRDVSPNTVIRQAIATEYLLATTVGPGDELLIKKVDGTFQKVVFQQEFQRPAL